MLHWASFSLRLKLAPVHLSKQANLLVRGTQLIILAARTRPLTPEHDEILNHDLIRSVRHIIDMKFPTQNAIGDDIGRLKTGKERARVFFPFLIFLHIIAGERRLFSHKT